MIAKRGRLVVKTKSGLKPATRKDLDGANIVGDRGPIYVETEDGIEPANVTDVRSAVGRMARQLVKNPATPFSDPALASRAGRNARAAESVETKQARAIHAGKVAIQKLTTEDRKASAKKAWETRRRRQSEHSE